VVDLVKRNKPKNNMETVRLLYQVTKETAILNASQYYSNVPLIANYDFEKVAGMFVLGTNVVTVLQFKLKPI
jgi:hypothetical protein